MNTPESSMQKKAEELKHQTAQIDDTQLDIAIRSGIRQARKRKTTRWIGDWKTMTAATVAVLLLIGTGLLVHDSFPSSTHTAMPADHQTPANLPSYFNKLYQQDILKQSLQPAIDHGLYQSIHLSDRSDSYTMTIDGVVADSKRIIVMYTAVDNQGGDPPRISDEKEARLVDRAMSMNTALSYNVTVTSTTPSTSHGALIFDYSKWQNVPNSVILNANLYSGSSDQNYENLQIPFALNTVHLKELEHTVVLNKIYDVNGYKIKLVRITRTPLRTDADLEWTTQQGKTIEYANVNLFAADPALHANAMLNVQGSSAYPNLGVTQYTFYYDSSYFSQDQSLWIQLAGIKFEMEKPLALVANTARSQLIQSPLPKASQISTQIDPDTGDTIVNLSIPKSGSRTIYYLQLNNTFHDAANQSYTIKKQDQHFTSSGTITYRLVLDSEPHYQQPLTFTIDDSQDTFSSLKQPITDNLQ
ncbi:DUF4179 domain-containing protein [Paenibacillus sp. WLX2291]|uniref:DUF4179 domain-containing protein n=1 Tax=Paenibacillus sp. WLX2291 TaxID=3296934 RepID=UPI00398404D1